MVDMTKLIDGDRLEAWRREQEGFDALFVQLVLDDFVYRAPQTPMEDIRPPAKELVRRHARGTSWEAALDITTEKRQRMFRWIYAILTRLGPKTDHEIRQILESKGVQHSWSGVSARRVELERAGWVRDSGEKRMTEFGKLATVWEAVPEEGTS
jgi:hypothetical protein